MFLGDLYLHQQRPFFHLTPVFGCVGGKRKKSRRRKAVGNLLVKFSELLRGHVPSDFGSDEVQNSRNVIFCILDVYLRQDGASTSFRTKCMCLLQKEKRKTCTKGHYFSSGRKHGCSEK